MIASFARNQIKDKREEIKESEENRTPLSSSSEAKDLGVRFLT